MNELNNNSEAVSEVGAREMSSSMTVSSKPTVKNMLRESWQFYTTHFQKIVIIMSLGLIATVISFFISNIFAQGVLAALDIVMSLASLIALLQFVNADGKISVAESFRSARSKIIPIFWMGILTGLLCIGAFVPFLIPVFYFLVAIGGAMYVIVAEQERGRAALARSWAYVSGRWWWVFSRSIAFIVVLIIPLVLLTIVVQMVGGSMERGSTSEFIVGLIEWLSFTPLVYIVSFIMYRWLKSSASISDASIQKKKKWITGLAIWGLAVIIIFTTAGGAAVYKKVKEKKLRGVGLHIVDLKRA